MHHSIITRTVAIIAARQLYEPIMLWPLAMGDNHPILRPNIN